MPDTPLQIVFNLFLLLFSLVKTFCLFQPINVDSTAVKAIISSSLYLYGIRQHQSNTFPPSFYLFVCASILCFFFLQKHTAQSYFRLVHRIKSINRVAVVVIIRTKIVGFMNCNVISRSMLFWGGMRFPFIRYSWIQYYWKLCLDCSKPMVWRIHLFFFAFQTVATAFPTPHIDFFSAFLLYWTDFVFCLFMSLLLHSIQV